MRLALASSPFSRSSLSRMGVMYGLLRRPELNSQELEHLFYASYYIIGYAMQHAKKDLSGLLPHLMVDQACRNFLVADFLWAVKNILGDAINPELWWNTAMQKLQISVEHLKGAKFYCSPYDKTELVIRVARALESFAAGKRPSAPETVQIKRAIFETPCASRTFRNSAFDPWRTDLKVYEEKRGRY